MKLDAPDPIQAAALYVYFWASPCRQVIMLLVQRYMRLYAEAVWYNSNESVRNFWDLSHGRALRDPYFSRRPHRLAPATPAPRAPWGSGGIRAAGADSAPNHRAAPTRRGRTPGLPPRGVRPRLAPAFEQRRSRPDCVRQRGPFRSTCGTSLRKAPSGAGDGGTRGGGRRGLPRSVHKLLRLSMAGVPSAGRTRSPRCDAILTMKEDALGGFHA